MLRAVCSIGTTACCESSYSAAAGGARPVLIRGALDNWPAMTKWQDMDYLCKVRSQRNQSKLHAACLSSPPIAPQHVRVALCVSGSLSNNNAHTCYVRKAWQLLDIVTRHLHIWDRRHAPVKQCYCVCGCYPVSLWLPCGLPGFAEPTTATVTAIRS
jgi:hypothetical protein